MATKETRFSFSGPTRSHYYATISPRETYLASSGIFSNTISLWSIETTQVVKELEGHENPVVAATFSDDEGLLASLDVEGVLKIWDLKSQEVIGTHQTGEPSHRAVHFGEGGVVIVESENGMSRSYRSDPPE